MRTLPVVASAKWLKTWAHAPRPDPAGTLSCSPLPSPRRWWPPPSSLHPYYRVNRQSNSGRSCPFRPTTSSRTFGRTRRLLDWLSLKRLAPPLASSAGQYCWDCPALHRTATHITHPLCRGTSSPTDCSGGDKSPGLAATFSISLSVIFIQPTCALTCRVTLRVDNIVKFGESKSAAARWGRGSGDNAYDGARFPTTGAESVRTN